MRPVSELTVIVPTLGEAKGLAKLFKSLEQQKQINLFEVILVDNSLNPKTNEELKKLIARYHLNIRLVFSQEKGVNHARNLGIQESQSEILLFVDDDCWFNDHLLLAKHIQFHQKNSQFFAIGGRYSLDVDAGFIDSCYHDIQMKWLSEGIVDSYTGQTHYLIGGHFSVKKSQLLQGNILFDSNIKYGGSEVSLFLQANKLGCLSKLENIYLIHSPNLNMLQVMRKLFRQGQGKYYLEQNYGKIEQSYSDRLRYSFLKDTFIDFLNKVFWFGYYKKKGHVIQFFFHILKETYQKLNQKRFELINKINRH